MFFHFQNTCIHINAQHKNKLTTVLVLRPSLKWWLTNIAYRTIPIPNHINLAGHNNPPVPETAYLVPHT